MNINYKVDLVGLIFKIKKPDRNIGQTEREIILDNSFINIIYFIISYIL